MKLKPVEKQVADYITSAYARFCTANLKANPPATLQQTVIHTGEGNILLRMGIEGGYLTTYAGLLLPENNGNPPKLFSSEFYETVVEAKEDAQIIDLSGSGPANDLREKILLAMWHSTESVVEAISYDYQDALKTIARNSPMKVVTHPDDVSPGYEMVDSVDDILDFMVRMEKEPSNALVEELEESLLLVEGTRATVFQFKPAA